MAYLNQEGHREAAVRLGIGPRDSHNRYINEEEL